MITKTVLSPKKNLTIRNLHDKELQNTYIVSTSFHAAWSLIPILICYYPFLKQISFRHLSTHIGFEASA